MTRLVRLWIVLVLNLALVVALVVVGWSARSLGVFAEGVDYAGDAAAIAVSLWAIWLSQRPPTVARPNGYPNATTWAAAINAGWLLVLSGAVVAGAGHRLIAGAHEVHGLPVLIVSGVAAVLMLGAALILGADAGDRDAPDGDGDLNMSAVLLDTAADAAGAAGVAVTGAVILATGRLFWLDPLIALAIALMVGFRAVRLLARIVTALRTSPGPSGWEAAHARTGRNN